MDYKEYVVKIDNKTKEFLGFVNSIGNECAYTDRIVEDILASADALRDAYRK